MENLTITSRSNTKIRTIVWGMIFIIFGLVLEINMLILCLEDFSIMKICAMLLFLLVPLAGAYSLQSRKYPLVLWADNLGIHYYINKNNWGYYKTEVLLPWKSIKRIATGETQVEEDYDFLEIELYEVDKQIISLADGNYTSSKEVVATLYTMLEFYTSNG